ncbi:MAG TPA: DUF1697 domain-containing protein, partial [Polyangiaceae bacterium]|nr:DUF1697 domain-containing protein [Polyangiaceae bacterium]
MNKPRRSPSQTSTYVALLRGINVGGKNRLPMSALVAMFEGCRCGEVRSYIQSGNVVFRADAALAARVPQLVAKCIADDFGFDAPLIVRTADDLREVGRSHPYLAALAGPGRLEGPSGPSGP